MRKLLFIVLVCHLSVATAYTNFEYCYNFGSGVSSGFTNCVDRNFDRIERAFNYTLYLPFCMNFSRTRVEDRYIDCVNDNFTTVVEELNRRGGWVSDLPLCYDDGTGGVSHQYQFCINGNFDRLEMDLP